MFENFEISDLSKSKFWRLCKRLPGTETPGSWKSPGRKGVGLTEDKKDQFMIQGSKNWSSDLKLRKSRNLFQTDRKCPFVENQKGLELRSIELKFFENRKF